MPKNWREIKLEKKMEKIGEKLETKKGRVCPLWTHAILTMKAVCFDIFENLVSKDYPSGNFWLLKNKFPWLVR